MRRGMCLTMWPPEDDEAFWNWSCERYARPGVAEACLSLQDRHGVQVNLMLLGCWLAERGRAVTAEQAGAIVERATAWQVAVVRPLREVRRRLKGWETQAVAGQRAGNSGLRRAVAAAELDAERIEQGELQRDSRLCPPDGQEVRASALANLAWLVPDAGDGWEIDAAVDLILDLRLISQDRNFRPG